MTKEPGITIVGLGLMGASLAMALRQRGYAGRLVAYARKEDTRREALARGIVDAAFADPDAALKGATRYTTDPKEILIAEACADAIEASGYFQDGWSVQMGSGGASLAKRTRRRKSSRKSAPPRAPVSRNICSQKL